VSTGGQPGFGVFCTVESPTAAGIFSPEWIVSQRYDQVIRLVDEKLCDYAMQVVDAIAWVGVRPF